jgi:uncharacterized protein (TIGR02996 family)
VTHVESLLREIHKDPMNDAPRLVLADHHEQEGEHDRASLIRLQIRRANLPWWDAQAGALELQERALLARREAAWRAELPSLDAVQWGSFTRGFVGRVAFDSIEAFEAHAEACLRAAPVHGIVLRWPRAAKPAKLAAIEALRELTIVGAVMKPEDLKWLAGCPLLSTVRSLVLLDAELRTGLPHLLKSPHLGALEALRIPRHHIGNAGVAKLVGASPPRLVALELSCGSDEELGSGRRSAGAPIGSKGVLELAAWPGLARVHTLDLSDSRLGVEGLRTLLASRTAALKILRLRNIKDSDWDMDDSLGAFAAGPVGAIDELDVGANDLDPDGAHALAEAKALRELKVLRLDAVRSKVFDRLAKASWVHSLRVLACDELALPHFLKRSPAQLHTLEVSPSTSPLSTVVEHLNANPPPALRTLDLSRCGASVDEEGLRRLGELELPTLASVVLPREGPRLGRAAFAGSRLGAQLASLDTGDPGIDRLPAPARISISDDYDGPLQWL